MPTKIKGVSHAMLGNPGSISKWIQIEDGPASLLANPAVLSGAAGIMAQLARQHEAKEFKQLLLSIDSKLDDVLRKQRDAVLAKMYGVSDAIAEARRSANMAATAKPSGAKFSLDSVRSRRSNGTPSSPSKPSQTRLTTRPTLKP